MGRQLGVVQYRGKLGQTVGMKNGFGGSQAFNREYVATNASESDAQIERRMRMLPAVNFRRQLADIIARGFQGVKYGGPSTREFMKFAMVLPLADTPQLLKNSTVAFPGPYLISKGSLGNIACTILEDEVDSNITTGDFEMWENWGDISQALIDGGLFKAGDLFTLITAYIRSAEQDNPTNVVYNVWSKQIDPDSTDIYTSSEHVLYLDESATSQNGTLTMSINAGYIVVGAAIINSREGTTPLRSTSRMAVNKALWPAFFGSTLKPDVKQSYKKTTNATMSSDWPVDPDVEPEDTGFVTISVIITPTGGGTVTGAGTYAKGDSVTLQATPAAEYGFGHWELNGVEVGTTRTLTITANANAQYTAEFLPET